MSDMWEVRFPVCGVAITVAGIEHPIGLSRRMRWRDLVEEKGLCVGCGVDGCREAEVTSFFITIEVATYL